MLFFIVFTGYNFPMLVNNEDPMWWSWSGTDEDLLTYQGLLSPSTTLTSPAPTATPTPSFSEISDDFRFLDEEETSRFNPTSVSDDSPVGYVIECDLECCIYMNGMLNVEILIGPTPKFTCSWFCQILKSMFCSWHCVMQLAITYSRQLNHYVHCKWQGHVFRIWLLTGLLLRLQTIMLILLWIGQEKYDCRIFKLIFYVQQYIITCRQ